MAAFTERTWRAHAHPTAPKVWAYMSCTALSALLGNDDSPQGMYRRGACSPDASSLVSTKRCTMGVAQCSAPISRCGADDAGCRMGAMSGVSTGMQHLLDRRTSCQLAHLIVHFQHEGQATTHWPPRPTLLARPRAGPSQYTWQGEGGRFAAQAAVVRLLGRYCVLRAHASLERCRRLQIRTLPTAGL